MDFNVLYGQNCSACHGREGRGGAAVGLADPEYMALVDDATLTRVTANGVRGTAMPGFAESAGGMLTNAQIAALVRGMRARWGRPANGVTLPSHIAQAPGSAERGAAVYTRFCASCHEANGKAGAKAGTVRDATYLSLISDQGLRTLVIVGRPDFGAPDWRNDVPGNPMTEQQISDVVAWLGTQRTASSSVSVGIGGGR
jgi:mono/diheme cytochrome c family protein